MAAEGEDFNDGVLRITSGNGVLISVWTAVSWKSGGAEPVVWTSALRGRAACAPLERGGLVRALAHELPGRAWRRVEWREGTEGPLGSRFARVRVRAAHRNRVHAEEWLVIEWPLAETEPTKYWLATVPQNITFKELVRLIKLRWRIERDYRELKQKLGLGPYEAATGGVFHHYATLTITAYGVLIRAGVMERMVTITFLSVMAVCQAGFGSFPGRLWP